MRIDIISSPRFPFLQQLFLINMHCEFKKKVCFAAFLYLEECSTTKHFTVDQITNISQSKQEASTLDFHFHPYL